jgi:hypothetical protein
VLKRWAKEGENGEEEDGDEEEEEEKTDWRNVVRSDWMSSC